MSNLYKICPYCGEEIKKEAIKCQYCHEFLEMDIKKCEVKWDEWKWNNSKQADLKERKGSREKRVVNEEVFRTPIDNSYIKCYECGYEWLWWRKRVTKVSDYIVRWAVATLIKETGRKDLVICPECGSSNIVETKLEKASRKDNFIAYWIPWIIVVVIILLIIFLS